jgi:hypothetical protein
MNKKIILSILFFSGVGTVFGTGTAEPEDDHLLATHSSGLNVKQEPITGKRASSEPVVGLPAMSSSLNFRVKRTCVAKKGQSKLSVTDFAKREPSKLPGFGACVPSGRSKSSLLAEAAQAGPALVTTATQEASLPNYQVETAFMEKCRRLIWAPFRDSNGKLGINLVLAEEVVRDLFVIVKPLLKKLTSNQRWDLDFSHSPPGLSFFIGELFLFISCHELMLPLVRAEQLEVDPYVFKYVVKQIIDFKARSLNSAPMGPASGCLELFGFGFCSLAGAVGYSEHTLLSMLSLDIVKSFEEKK